MTDQRPLLLFAANAAWNVANFRLDLIAALEKAGFAVAVSVPPGADADRLEGLGLAVHRVPMQPRGMSPLADARLLVAYRRLIGRLRPAAFLGFTIKPNVYGSLAAHSAGVPVINNVSGLGTLFMRRSLLRGLAQILYRSGLARSATVFFQNPDDSALFLEKGLVRAEQVRLLPGSGIDLERFRPAKLAEWTPTFLLAGRMLWDKGIREYVEAARIVRSQVPDAKFRMLGIIERGPAAVPVGEIEAWAAAGDIEWLGATDDVRPHIAAADCAVLPSYREGTPRFLLEAAAMARPSITTDAPGCRNAVDDGVTGLLCEPRSARSLADAILAFIALSSAERTKMARAARAKMERSFSLEIVHRAYLDALRDAGVVSAGSGRTAKV